MYRVQFSILRKDSGTLNQNSFDVGFYFSSSDEKPFFFDFIIGMSYQIQIMIIEITNSK